MAGFGTHIISEKMSSMKRSSCSRFARAIDRALIDPPSPHDLRRSVANLDWRVVAFVAIAASVSTLLVSLWPLRRSLRPQPAAALGFSYAPSFGATFSALSPRELAYSSAL